MTKESRQLVALVAALSEETYNTVLSRCRRRPLPVCRYLVAQELMHRGWSSQKAAREIGLNHVTVLHGNKVLDQITEVNGYTTDEMFIKRDFLRLKDDL
jgi:hypothetical protein